MPSPPTRGCPGPFQSRVLPVGPVGDRPNGRLEVQSHPVPGCRVHLVRAAPDHKGGQPRGDSSTAARGQAARRRLALGTLSARPREGDVRGRSSMAELQSSKLTVRVRFPSPAPRSPVQASGIVAGPGPSRTLRSCARRWRASSGRRAVRLRWCHAALAEADARGIEVLRLRWHPRQRRPCRRRRTARMTATSSDSAHDSGPSRSEQRPFAGSVPCPGLHAGHWPPTRGLNMRRRRAGRATGAFPVALRMIPLRSTSYPYRTITMCTRAIRATSLQMTEYPLDEYQPNAAQYFTKL